MTFCIYHQYSDRSNKPEFIYAGTDKAEAFDALWKFIQEGDTSAGGEIHMATSPTEYMKPNQSRDTDNV